jgi:hypothetical protein
LGTEEGNGVEGERACELEKREVISKCMRCDHPSEKKRAEGRMTNTGEERTSKGASKYLFVCLFEGEKGERERGMCLLAREGVRPSRIVA